MTKNENAKFLTEQLSKPTKLYQLWKWKRKFYEIPEEIYRESPLLSSGMSMILVMEGRMEEAKKFLNYTETDEKIHDYTKLMFPTLLLEEFLPLLIKLTGKNEKKMPNLTLTASRPTVINGVKDFTLYGDLIKTYKNEIVRILGEIYGEAAQGAYEIALAEYLYQRDECFEALVLIAGIIPFMENKKDLRCLFAALTLEMYILVMNGQAASTVPLMENLKKRVEHEGIEELKPNIDALEVFSSLYDNDMDRIDQWMENEAPDEYADFNMLDTFRYMIKLRVYLLQGKHVPLFILAEKLKYYLSLGNREMDTCELHLIVAMSLYEQGRKEQAFERIEEALALAEKNRYDRLVGDEGKRIYHVLYDYRKERGSTPYLERVMGIARKIGLLYPNYLKQPCSDIPKISAMEMEVLRLLAEEKRNGEIAEYLDITINTVKFHTKNIFKKLSVKSRGQAVKKAKEIGIV